MFRFPSSKFYELLRHYNPFGIEKDIGCRNGNGIYKKVHVIESYLFDDILRIYLIENTRNSILICILNPQEDIRIFCRIRKAIL